LFLPQFLSENRFTLFRNCSNAGILIQNRDKQKQKSNKIPEIPVFFQKNVNFGKILTC